MTLGSHRRQLYLEVLLVGLLLPGMIGCQKGRTTKMTQPEKPARVFLPGAKALILGSISRSPDEESRDFQPICSLLQDLLEMPVRSRIEADTRAMLTSLKTGAIDLYFDSALPILEIYRLSGIAPSLKWKKHGLDDYYSILFARRDSGISTPADLPGHSFVFSEKTSTSGYGLPRTLLLRAGLQLVEAQQRKNSDDVQFIFSGDSENTIFWVLEKKGEAGAINSEYFLSLAGIRRSELKIISRSPTVPRGLVSFGPKLSGELRERISRTLLDAGSKESTLARLKEFKGSTGFEGLSADDLRRMAAALDIGAPSYEAN